MGTVLIKNGRVWDGENFFFADVMTVGKVIAKIDKSINENADFIFDAKGKIVTAGLADLHVHSKGISSDEYGINAEMSSFPFGVTAINNAGTAFASKAFSDFCAVKNTVFLNSDESTEKHLSNFGEKAVGIKVYFDTSFGVTDEAPLKKACAFAREHSLKVMVHCSNSPVSMVEIINALSEGDIVTHVFHGGENNCVENNFEAFRVARQKGVVMDSGFAGFVHTDFKNLRLCAENGYFPDTISTDITRYSAFKRGGRYGMTTCMSIAKTVGMSEEEIFKATTSSPARVLGKDSEWGYLREGRCADIAVLDYTDEGFDMTDKCGNRLKNDKGYRCILTVSDGEIVYRN